LIEMRERLAGRPMAAPGVSPAESRPRGSEFPEQLVVLVGLMALVGALAAGAHALDDSPPWSRMVRVDAQHGADAALALAFHQVSTLGIGDAAAAYLRKRVDDDVKAEVAAHGRAQLSLGMLVDVVSASKAANWSAEDMARLVIALDAVLDEGHAGDVPRLEALVAHVRHGAEPGEILGVGDTLKAISGR
jgi:hypothetical protein